MNSFVGMESFLVLRVLLHLILFFHNQLSQSSKFYREI